MVGAKRQGHLPPHEMLEEMHWVLLLFFDIDTSRTTLLLSKTNNPSLIGTYAHTHLLHHLLPRLQPPSF